MWFFMILAYLLVLLAGVGLAAIGLNHYLDLWVQQHITLDLLVSIVFIAAQTLVMFFFVGTGVNIREYVQSHPGGDASFHRDILSVKRQLYPPTLLVTVLFMATVILDGTFYLGRSSEWWFHGGYILTVYFYIRATRIQHFCFVESTAIILKMTGTKPA